MRESFSRFESFDFFNPAVPDGVPDFWWADGDPDWGNWTKPMPSIHMPRAACRIELEVTGVRVERLQAITEAAASAKGADPIQGGPMTPEEQEFIDLPLLDAATPYRNGFAVLWESINSAGSWAMNPRVWVVEFRRLAP